MILLSADRSFGIIAAQKNLLSRQQLQQLEAELRGLVEGGARVSLEQLCLRNKVLDAEGIKRIVMTRARHGRSCSDCGAVTFLLPGQRSQSTPCEHCGGPLSGGRVDTPQNLSRAAPAGNGPSSIEVKREYLKLLARCAKEEEVELFIRTANLAVDLNYIDQARMLLAKALELSPSHPYAMRRFEDLSQRQPTAPSLPGRNLNSVDSSQPAPLPRAPSAQRESTRYVALVKAPVESPPLAKPEPAQASTQSARSATPAAQDPALESLDFHGADTYIDEDEPQGRAAAIAQTPTPKVLDVAPSPSGPAEVVFKGREAGVRGVPARAEEVRAASESQPGSAPAAIDKDSLEILLNAPAGYGGPVAPEGPRWCRSTGP